MPLVTYIGIILANGIIVKTYFRLNIDYGNILCYSLPEVIEINKRIKEIRLKLGLTQAQFAENLGVTNATISRLEAGERSISEATVKSICREFGVSYLWLTTGSGEMFEELGEEAALYEMVDRVLAGQNPRVRSIFKSLADFTPEDWAHVERLLDKLLAGWKPWEEDGVGIPGDAVEAFTRGYEMGYRADKDKKTD